MGSRSHRSSRYLTGFRYWFAGNGATLNDGARETLGTQNLPLFSGDKANSNKAIDVSRAGLQSGLAGSSSGVLPLVGTADDLVCHIANRTFSSPQRP
jgi:hypothetical protein